MSKIILFFTVAVFWGWAVNSQIVVDSFFHFQPSVVGEEFGALENTNDPDSGGILTIFVSNLSPVADSIVSISVCNDKGDTLIQKTWWYVWPKTLDAIPSASREAAVVIKSQLNAFSDGKNLKVNVLTKNGHTASRNLLLKQAPVKIANIIPNHSLSALNIYLRNETNNTYQLLSFSLNQTTYSLNNPNIRLIGGNEIKPGGIKIIELNSSKNFEPLSPLMLKITVLEKNNSKPYNIACFVRLVPPDFSYGTWDSPLFNPDKEEGRKTLRQLGLTAVHGPGNPILMQDAHQEYFYKAMWEPSLNNMANTVKQHAQSEFVLYWSIDDEPDLNNKNIDTQLLKNNIYWENDPNTPSYVNLCTQKKYQRYGWYADVVSMDHYTDNGAPNVIPLSWITREGSPREAIEYTEALKFNTEPRRLRSWCQLAVKGTWRFQPEDYIINFQYWAHIMSGAKGIDFFCAKPSTPSDFPKQWNEAKLLVQQTNPIKNLLLFAEPINNIKTSYQGDVESRMLVGKDYAIIIVLNDSIDYTPVNIINQEWRSDIWRKNFSIEFELPDWVQPSNIYEQTSSGKIPLQGLVALGNNRFRIAGEIFKRSRVFVFAPGDNTPSAAPPRGEWADISGPNTYTLSWQEPLDNFGVKGYILKADGKPFAKVNHPILDVKNGPNLCSFNTFEIIAYDEAGNESNPLVLQSPRFDDTTGNVAIINTLNDTSVQAGEVVVFSIADTGTGKKRLPVEI
ncbi:MAG: hypothetical protein RMJ53_02870 [Chitinophagales bacterium]|nr:hypothetical protein [Chitinophagales bacterium]